MTYKDVITSFETVIKYYRYVLKETELDYEYLMEHKNDHKQWKYYDLRSKLIRKISHYGIQLVELETTLNNLKTIKN